MDITPASVQEFHCPRWNELPDLQLYMDQVVTILQSTLAIFSEDGDPVVTKTMINNYVKQEIIEPPLKKKYGKSQLAQLMIISLLKKVFSISEIHTLIGVMMEKEGIEAAYNLFCERLEALLGDTFASSSPVHEGTIHQESLDTALMALISKIAVQNYLSSLAADKDLPIPSE